MSDDYITLAGNIKTELPKAIPREIEDFLKENFKSYFLVVETDEDGEGNSVHSIGACDGEITGKRLMVMLGAINKAIVNVMEQLGYETEAIRMS